MSSRDELKQDFESVVFDFNAATDEYRRRRKDQSYDEFEIIDALRGAVGKAVEMRDIAKRLIALLEDGQNS